MVPVNKLFVNTGTGCGSRAKRTTFLLRLGTSTAAPSAQLDLDFVECHWDTISQPRCFPCRYGSDFSLLLYRSEVVVQSSHSKT